MIPFTEDVIEPAEPFSLGVMVTNNGAGIARDFSITSAQPKIIENEKGLLINFKLIGTRLDGEAIGNSFTVDLGDLEPNQTKVGEWLLTSSLRGTFIEYEATYTHADELGGEKTSLIESLEVH